MKRILILGLILGLLFAACGGEERRSAPRGSVLPLPTVGVPTLSTSDSRDYDRLIDACWRSVRANADLVRFWQRLASNPNISATDSSQARSSLSHTKRVGQLRPDLCEAYELLRLTASPFEERVRQANNINDNGGSLVATFLHNTRVRDRICLTGADAVTLVNASADWAGMCEAARQMSDAMDTMVFRLSY